MAKERERLYFTNKEYVRPTFPIITKAKLFSNTYTCNIKAAGFGRRILKHLVHASKDASKRCKDFNDMAALLSCLFDLDQPLTITT